MVALKNLALGNTGNYACEVSGEAPKFKTSAGAGKMMVIDLPDERPIIKVCVSVSVFTSKPSVAIQNKELCPLFNCFCSLLRRAPA